MTVDSINLQGIYSAKTAWQIRCEALQLEVNLLEYRYILHLNKTVKVFAYTGYPQCYNNY